MPVPKKVKDYLDKQGIDYDEISHKVVYTAYDAARTLKRELKEIAKNLLVQADKTYALVIVPADKRINLDKLKKVLGVKRVSIPKEQAMIKILKIKPGSLTSFGKLHQLEVVVDKAMVSTKKAVFSAGSLTDSVFMKVKDFLQLEEAKIADIAMAGGYTIPKAIKKQMKSVKAKVAKKTGKRAVKKGVKKAIAKKGKKISKKRK